MNESDTPQILVVDDQKSNVDLIADSLSGYGYTILKATNGPTALELAKANNLDLILLDVNMPHMNGYEVIHELKANPQLQDVPVIFVSAINDLQVKIDGFKEGAVDYITKPFQQGELQARVKTQIALRKKQLEIDRLKQQEIASLHKISQLKDDMLRMVAHDIKSPLSNIIGCVRLLEMQDEDYLGANPEIHEYIGMIEHAADRILGVVKEVLETETNESNADLRREAVGLTAYLQEQVTELQFSAREAHIELHFVPPKEDTEIMIAPARFGHVLQNLMTNALKYTPTGGTVEVSAQVLPSEVQIRVRDTGLGIPEEDLPYLFDKYYRVQSAEHRKRTGSGIGLAIVKTIVDQHGGHVWAESVPGKGSTFIISLPLAETPVPNPVT